MQKRTWKAIEDISNEADYLDFIAEENDDETAADGFAFGADHAYDVPDDADWFEE